MKGGGPQTKEWECDRWNEIDEGLGEEWEYLFYGVGIPELVACPTYWFQFRIP